MCTHTIPECYLKLDHGHFLQYSFQFIHHSIIRQYRLRL
jgi:hypothetical protein